MAGGRLQRLASSGTGDESRTATGALKVTAKVTSRLRQEVGRHPFGAGNHRQCFYSPFLK